MIKESKQLIEQYRRRFKRIRNTRYWIVIVDNHFFDKYYFFIYEQKLHTQLVKSHELAAIKHDKELFKQVLHDFKSISQLSIEYRDTRHLVEPIGREIKVDKIHGHNF